MKLEKRFEKYDDEYIEFDRIENKRSKRPDLHAFMLLDELFPAKNDTDMISAAEHDQICLNISAKQINSLDDEELIELIRCGVIYDSGTDSICMFV